MPRRSSSRASSAAERIEANGFRMLWATAPAISPNRCQGLRFDQAFTLRPHKQVAAAHDPKKCNVEEQTTDSATKPSDIDTFVNCVEQGARQFVDFDNGEDIAAVLVTNREIGLYEMIALFARRLFTKAHVLGFFFVGRDTPGFYNDLTAKRPFQLFILVED